MSPDLKPKPLVYLMSPYTKGDPASNVHFQCKMFDELVVGGVVTPIVPLWSHFQHLIIPHPYDFWMDYDREIIIHCDAGLRLSATLPHMGYIQVDSPGAEREKELFFQTDKPVFHSVDALYAWAEEWRNDE